LTLQRTSTGWRLRGEKHWCSGASLVTHALVTADESGRDGGALVCVPIESNVGTRIELCPPTWTSPAFAATDTRTVAFDLDLDADAVIGRDDWYLRRAGFWWGAVGVAACWAGCAAGVVDHVDDRWPHDPHALAHLGAIDAALEALRAVLTHAAYEIDAVDPDDDAGGAGRMRALRVRHIVDVLVADITSRLPRALGPGPLAHDPDLHIALAEVDLYRRQCHAERDLEQLGTDIARAHITNTETTPCAPSLRTAR
jgi:alkylation response protein AidB-like acyl-CoA dehydrogenase